MNDDYQQPAQPGVVVLMPQMQPAPPPVPAPAPVHPETRDYNWTASASGLDTAVFTLVSKDQRVESAIAVTVEVESAIAVTVEGNRIFYITPDGGHKEMSMGALDRERTRKRNAENQLKLPWLG